MSEHHQPTFFLDNPAMYHMDTSVFNYQQYPTNNGNSRAHLGLGFKPTPTTQARSAYQKSNILITKERTGGSNTGDDMSGSNQRLTFKDARSQSSQALFGSQLSDMMDFNLSHHANPKSWDGSATGLDKKSDALYSLDDSGMQAYAMFSGELDSLADSDPLLYHDINHTAGSGSDLAAKSNSQEFYNPMELHLAADFFPSSQDTDYDIEFDVGNNIPTTDNIHNDDHAVIEARKLFAYSKSSSASCCSLSGLTSPVSPASSISSFSSNQSFLSDLTNYPVVNPQSFFNEEYTATKGGSIDSLSIHRSISRESVSERNINMVKLESVPLKNDSFNKSSFLISPESRDTLVKSFDSPKEGHQTGCHQGSKCQRGSKCQKSGLEHNELVGFHSSHNELKEENNARMFNLDDEDEFSEISSEEEDLDIEVETDETDVDKDMSNEDNEILEVDTTKAGLGVSIKQYKEDKDRHEYAKEAIAKDLSQPLEQIKDGSPLPESEKVMTMPEPARTLKHKTNLSVRSSLSTAKRVNRRRVLSISSSSSSSSSESSPSSSKFPMSPNTRGRKPTLALDLSKSFVCEYCSRRFRRQEHLKRHFRSLHTREKPYECEDCGKTFSRSDNLTQHVRTHVKLA